MSIETKIVIAYDEKLKGKQAVLKRIEKMFNDNVPTAIEYKNNDIEIYDEQDFITLYQFDNDDNGYVFYPTDLNLLLEIYYHSDEYNFDGAFTYFHAAVVSNGYFMYDDEAIYESGIKQYGPFNNIEVLTYDPNDGLGTYESYYSEIIRLLRKEKTLPYVDQAYINSITKENANAQYLFVYSESKDRFVISNDLFKSSNYKTEAFNVDNDDDAIFYVLKKYFHKYPDEEILSKKTGKLLPTAKKKIEQDKEQHFKNIINEVCSHSEYEVGNPLFLFLYDFKNNKVVAEYKDVSLDISSYHVLLD